MSTKVTITLELTEDEAAQLLALGRSMMVGLEPAGIVRACIALHKERSAEWERRHLAGGIGTAAGGLGLAAAGRAALTRAEGILAGRAAVAGAVEGALYGGDPAQNGNGQSQ